MENRPPVISKAVEVEDFYNIIKQCAFIHVGLENIIMDAPT